MSSVLAIKQDHRISMGLYQCTVYGCYMLGIDTLEIHTPRCVVYKDWRYSIYCVVCGIWRLERQYILCGVWYRFGFSYLKGEFSWMDCRCVCACVCAWCVCVVQLHMGNIPSFCYVLFALNMCFVFFVLFCVMFLLWVPWRELALCYVHSRAEVCLLCSHHHVCFYTCCATASWAQCKCPCECRGCLNVCWTSPSHTSHSHCVLDIPISCKSQSVQSL